MLATMVTSGVVEAKSPKQNPLGKQGATNKELTEVGKIICAGRDDFDKIIFKKTDYTVIRADDGKYQYEDVSAVTVMFKCKDGHTFILSGPNTNQIITIESIPPEKENTLKSPDSETKI